jgi:hypothetical protein
MKVAEIFFSKKRKLLGCWIINSLILPVRSQARENRMSTRAAPTK